MRKLSENAASKWVWQKREFAPSAVSVLIALVNVVLVVRSLDLYVSGAVLALVLAVFLVAGSVGVLWIGSKVGWRQECCFIFIFALFGLLTLMAIPPFSTPDSYHQYIRAYEIAHGHLIPQFDPWPAPDDVFPYTVDPEMREVLGYSGESGYETWSGTMALYSPVGFLPAALGIFLVDPLSGNALVPIYVARVFTLASAGALLFTALRIMPIGKTVFALSALLPVMVELYSWMSPDVVVISLIYCLVAYVLRLRFEGGKVSLPIVAVLVVCLSLVKIVYLPVCLIVLLIPAKCYATRGQKAAFTIVLAVVAVVSNIGWLAFASSQLVGHQFHEGVDSAAQVQFVMSHPISYMAMNLRTVLHSGAGWVEQMFGSALNSFSAFPPRILPYCLMAVFGYACVRERMEKKGPRLDWGVRSMLLIIVALVVVLTFGSLFVQWTASGASEIDGIQGRYFIPVLPLAIIALFPYEGDWKPRNTWAVWICVLTLIFTAPLEISL